MLKRCALFLVALVGLALLIRFMMDAGGSDGWYGLKPLFIPLAILYLNAFNSPATAILLCVAMVVVGMALQVYYWRWRIAPTIASLRMAIDELQGVHGEPGSAAVLEGIDGVMSRFGLVSRSWALYRASLIKGEDGRMRSPVPPSRYFDIKALELSGLRLRIYFELPNDFVGIGLVFTFLGLVAGLYFASKSMLSADLGDARTALVMLLHAATFKFLTSITGICLSLLISWLQRVLLDRLDEQLDELQYLLEEKLPLAGGAISIASSQAPRARTAPTLRRVEN